VTPDSLYAQLLRLAGAALVLPLGIGADRAAWDVSSVCERHPERDYMIGEHIAWPRHAEALHHVRIERLPDDG
jgi:hypothetical protein